MRRSGAVGWFLHDVKNRGITAWLLAGLFTWFYITLYFTEKFENFAKGIFGLEWNNKWYLYGTLYTIAIVLGGLYVIWKYRHNRYQIVRTLVVMFVQTAFSFAIPLVMDLKNGVNSEWSGFYFSYFWPLKFYAIHPYAFQHYAVPLVLYSLFGAFVLVPLLSILFGKRWYCSWVCGCGGLANTLGEPWRHLSSKGSAAWVFERFAIYTVMLVTFLTTALILLGAIAPSRPTGLSGVLSPEAAGGLASQIGTLSGLGTWLNHWYDVVIGAVLAGIVGVGLYPIGGTRLWCRNFCPMAALLGLTQKFGRYRIRVKNDMCISCGLCSKYCEMGIDVRSYAQANTSFTRASCVGCGLCAEVCPRGVLRLENVAKKDPQELIQITTLDESWKGSRMATPIRV
jgi:ferredoxin-type protein NapH